MSYIYLRTGDEFLLNQKLNSRKQNFINNHGSQNIFDFPNPEDNILEIMDSILGSGLFTAKKMIIINNIPPSSNTNKLAGEKIIKIAEYIINNHKKISNDTMICLVSPNPDGRIKIYKDLISTKEITKEEFKFSEKEAAQVIKTNCPQITNDAIIQLIYMSNKDLYKIYNDSYKLGFLSRQVNIDDINYLVENAKKADPFGLLGYIIKNDKENIIGLIDNKSSFSEDINEFLGAVRWSLRIVISYYEASIINKDSKFISENTKLSPMHSSQLKTNYVRVNQNIQRIKKIYHDVLELEYNLKTGKLPKEVSRICMKQLLLG